MPKSNFKTINLILLVLVFLLAECTPADPQACSEKFLNTPHIVIETAFGIEAQAVVDQANVVAVCQIGYIDYYTINSNEQEIVLFVSGVGTDLAQASTQLTLENLKVELLVFSGIAGEIDSSLDIGQTTIPKHWFMLGAENESIAIDPSLMKIASQIDEVTIVDNGVSSNEFVSEQSLVDELKTNFNASIVDMETFVVTLAAQDFDVPFIAFRSVSDPADGTKDPADYQLAADNSAQATLEFIQLYLQEVSTPK
jgi:adenosylhomocysteine nucleosidase